MYRGYFYPCVVTLLILANRINHKSFDWLITWCLSPILAKFQLYSGIAKCWLIDWLNDRILWHRITNIDWLTFREDLAVLQLYGMIQQISYYTAFVASYFIRVTTRNKKVNLNLIIKTLKQSRRKTRKDEYITKILPLSQS